MRAFWIVPSLLLLPCACTSPADQAPPRPERESLLARAGSLRGVDVVEETSGPWVIRNLRRPEGVAGAEGPAGEPGAEWSTSIGLGGGAGGKFGGRAGGRSRGVDAGEEVEGEVLADAPVLAMEAEPAPAGPSTPGPAARSLRAGATDDNEDHDAFVAFLAAKREPLKGRIEFIDVADRRRVRVVDSREVPLPGAEVAGVDEETDQVIWRGTTYGDGSFPIFPSLLPEGASETVLLEVRVGDRFLRQHWNLKGEECLVKIPKLEGGLDEVELDVVFLIDTTGSMGDEIEQIKATLLAVTEKLQNIDREFDLRYGAVLYRDIADAYVTKAHPFTDDLTAFDAALQGIAAGGGGDTPESLNQGLAVAVDGMKWRKGAAKLVFLIADAPPHLDYENDVPYGESLEAAVAIGIRIHSVAASGLDTAGSTVFRQIAHFTGGKFIFIEYGGDVKKSGESHGVSGVEKSNNLDDIIFEQIRDEVAHWGRS